MIQEKYAKLQEAWIEANDLKIGDTVKVVRKSNQGEMGWSDTWMGIMDEAVGKEGKINCFNKSGIAIKVNGVGSWSYPCFVLQKVKSALPKIKISDSLTAEILEGGQVRAGCQTLNFAKIEEIYNAAKKHV